MVNKMENKDAIEILIREKQMTCGTCMHPQMVGYCENYCRLPEAYDKAIEALKTLDTKIEEDRT